MNGRELTVLALFAVALGLYLVNLWRTSVRRARLRSVPPPASWLEILRADVPLFSRLPPPLQSRLLGEMQIFLDEKRIEGCGGLEVTEQMRVIIAAQACLLLVNRPHDHYRLLDTILLYPSGFHSASTERVGPHTIERVDAKAGESWFKGLIVLSWDDVLSGVSDPDDGHDVLLHEFAHQLDFADGYADGVPSLASRRAYAAWTKTLSESYQKLSRRLAHGLPAHLRSYAATNKAELFAVATESFFERPAALKEHYPALYAELAGFYRLDPANWSPPDPP